MRVRNSTGTSRKAPVVAGENLQGEGVIVAHLGVAVEVLFAGGGRQQVRIKRRSGHVVGDLVTVSEEVLTRLPRKTELRRRDAAGIHLVGANLDVLGVVVAPLPAPPAGFIDRAFVAARAAGLQPFLVINKCDLDGADEMVSELREIYGRSAPLFPVCAATGRGFELLEEFLGLGHRGAFVGITGVGKSSLLNALCPEIDLRVGALNDYNDRGRHTTTVATLHTLAAGGELIDTPGFQDFGLVDITAQQLALHFPGFEETGAVACRFRDCRHRTEPGCAVAGMVANGVITEERYETYLEILTGVEASEEENRRREWK
jgi:ribosome biogenesis GTPase / thiamine phosphate phosphatase